MKILSRYVLREHIGPLAFALTALTSLLLLNFIAKRFGDLVGKGLPASVITEFFALAIPFTVAMTLPMAVLVAVLYAFSRLASESEINALKASGVSMSRILAPVLGGATVLAVGMVFFNDYILPAANHRLRILQTDIGRTKPTFALREQVINEIISGRLFLRAGRIDKAKNRLHEVVIYDFGDGSKRRTIVADSGDLALVEGSGDMSLQLYHGTMTEIPSNAPTQLSRLSYATDHILVRGVANSFSRDSADSYKSEREMGVCEMQQQVYGAEKDLFRESRSAAMMQRRALRALTRGVVDSLAPIDSLSKPSPGIGRYYCEATTALMAFFSGGDSTTRARGKATNAPVTTSPTIAPVVTPNDAQARVVPAGVTPAPAAAAPPAVAVAPAAAPPTPARTPVSAAAVRRGAPIALRFPRGGVGLVIGASLGVFSLYYVCLIAGESMADDGVVPPWVAMWTANLVFTIVGIVLFLRMGREGSTSRGGDLDDVKDRVLGWVASLRPSARRSRVAPVPAADR